ncbi:phage terminase large subunit [Spirillospora sp. CA-253888]
MSLTLDPVAGVARAMLAQLDAMYAPPKPRRWATPGRMAQALDRNVGQTAALDLIDAELVELADGDTTRLQIYCPPQEGKALALDTPIATPTGWTTMGELSAGDQVFDRHGVPCTVTWVSPIWEGRPCYTVRTGDGEAIVADIEHEWPARLCRTGPEQLHTTKVLSRPRVKNAQITGTAGLHLPDADLPLDPYVLGAWLGDGSTTAAMITSADPEITDRIRASGVPCRKAKAKYAWSLTPGDGSTRCSPVRKALVDLGVWDNKHVPDAYHRGSTKQRLALLQGLIDTDGYVHPKGQVEFVSVSKRLALDVQELVYSLGAKATLREGRATINGRDCGPKYRVKFYLADAAYLPRKAARCKDSSVARVRYVWAEPAESVPTRCIEVNSPDHTYLAGRSLLPTHNSQRVSRWFPLWLLEHDPTLRIGIVSYNDRKALRWGKAIRRDLQTHPHLGITLRADTRAAGHWETEEGGGVICVGIGGGITGEPLDILIIDDPFRGRAEAESPTYRDAAWDWWESNGSTRLSARGRVVLMNTRWHEDDLSGRLVRKEPGRWRVVSIPAIAGKDIKVKNADGTERTEWVADGPDPLGRTPGEELISVQGREPGYFHGLHEIRSPYVWRSVFQQNPVAAEGNLFRRHSFRYWTPLPADDSRHGVTGGQRVDLAGRVVFLDDCWRFATADLAASRRTSADWTVISAWAISPDGDLILLDRVRKRVVEEDHWDLARPLMSRWSLGTVFVERGFIGSTMVIDATQAGVPVEPVAADTDKVTRAIPASNRCKTGRAWFPAAASWLDDWCDELAAFPSGTNDDQVDTFSYAARVVAAHWLPQGAGQAVDGRRPRADEGVIGAAYSAATGAHPNGTDYMNLNY